MTTPSDDDELRSWIDEHDAPVPASEESELEAQRSKQESADDDEVGATERPDDELGALINNTGDDGGAASG